MAGFINISSADARLPLSVGKASDGREQVLSLTTTGKTVRLHAEDAAVFIGAVGAFTAGAENGNARDEVFLHIRVVDFDGDTALRVKLEIARGLPIVTLDDEIINLSLESLGELAAECWEARSLAANCGRRRGRGMGKLLADRCRQQARRHAMQDQASPPRSQVESILDSLDRRGDY